MTATISQKNRFIAIDTPLGKDVLGLVSMTGREELGRLFQFEAELVSRDFDVSFDKIIGEKVSLRLETGRGGTRYFHGYVSRFQQTGVDRTQHFARYQAMVVPWLWLLTRRADCRIYQNQTVPQILKDVFKRSGVAEYELHLSGTYQPWEYCVQYRETDFNFVSRLMEHEGIYYFFEHGKSKHTLVLCDSPGAHEARAGYERIKYRPQAARAREAENIQEWTVGQGLESGVYAHTDYDFKMPGKQLLAKASIKRRHAWSELEVFDYPGEYSEGQEGKAEAKVRIQEVQARHERMEGQADARGVAVGHTFELQEFPRRDQCREYLVVRTDIAADAGEFASGGGGSGEAFQCGFAVLDAKEYFRPERLTPKPVVQGPQTAVVVGPKGEEIYVDEHARVKVQFHWDRYGRRDEKSSCWMRVSQPWAGKGYGGMNIPRIGQEVIVEFLEGDPDQPIINGRVYNAESMPHASNAGRDGKPGNAPPSNIPQAAMMTSFKSSSTPGGGGSNEITMNDAAGAEGLYLKAQRDEIHQVGNDREDTVGKNETRQVAVDRSREVGNNETVKVGVNREKTIGSNETEKIGANKNITVGGNHTEQIGGSMSLNVGTNQSVNVGGNKSESVAVASAENVGAAKALNIGAAYQVSVGAVMNESVAGAKLEEVGAYRMEAVAGNKNVTIGGDLDVSTSGNHSDAATEIKLTGKTRIVLECGASTVVLDPGMITITAPLVKINC